MSVQKATLSRGSRRPKAWPVPQWHCVSVAMIFPSSGPEFLSQGHMTLPFTTIDGTLAPTEPPNYPNASAAHYRTLEHNVVMAPIIHAHCRPSKVCSPGYRQPPCLPRPQPQAAVPGVPTYPKPRNLQYIFCGFPIFQSCGSSQHRPKDGPNLVQEGANIARRWAKIAPKMASWSKRGQHSRKLVQRRPKMRLLQTLRMGHSHNNNNKNNNKNKNKQTTNNNRRPYKHPAIYGAFF